MRGSGKRIDLEDTARADAMLLRCRHPIRHRLRSVQITTNPRKHPIDSSNPRTRGRGAQDSRSRGAVSAGRTTARTPPAGLARGDGVKANKAKATERERPQARLDLPFTDPP